MRQVAGGQDGEAEALRKASGAVVPFTPAALALAAGLPLDRRPHRVYVAGLGPGSRRAMARALETIAELASGGRLDADSLPWWELGYQHTGLIRRTLAERFAPATANRHLSALRGVLRECFRLELMDAEAYHRATDLKAVKGSRLPAGREVKAGELARLFDAAGPRDAALLALLYGAGLRRAEAVALDLEDLQDGVLRVRGKGSKERTAHVTNGAAEALAAWLQVRGTEPGPLLCPVRKGGRVEVRRMTDQAVHDALQRLAEAAKVKHLSAHDLRRSFVSHLLDRGADIATVQRMAGHASPTTTARYDRRGEETKRKAAELLPVPFVGR